MCNILTSQTLRIDREKLPAPIRLHWSGQLLTYYQGKLLRFWAHPWKKIKLQWREPIVSQCRYIPYSYVAVQISPDFFGQFRDIISVPCRFMCTG